MAVKMSSATAQAAMLVLSVGAGGINDSEKKEGDEE